MSELTDTERYLVGEPPRWLTRPTVRLQPILARQGRPNIDLEALAENIEGIGELNDPIAVESPGHWAEVVGGLGEEVDGILPVSVPCYPTEVWNSHPRSLVERGLPVVFWPIIAHDEPDLWRWGARDFLAALGVDVHLAISNRHGLALLRSLGLRRMLRDSSLVVFGKQNFPWNVHEAGHLVTEGYGTRLVVRSLQDIRERYPKYGDEQVEALWSKRKGRYAETSVEAGELRQAVRTYLAVKEILEEERALGFGVNCFGELLIEDGRDVPCLAQTLLREDGYIASCDGDYLTMMGMLLSTHFLDKPCMMSNIYPIAYSGALEEHFGDPLSPNRRKYPEKEWGNLARLGHCGWVGIVSPEMDPRGRVALHDWGGTYEIRRDGRGCGIDGELASGQRCTVLQPKFDGRTVLVADAEVCETTRHEGMPHCESTALLSFRDLPGVLQHISREHVVVVYGEHVEDYEVLCGVLNLVCKVF